MTEACYNLLWFLEFRNRKTGVNSCLKEVEEYTVESFKETSVMLTTQNGSMEVQKYKLPLELEIGDILIQNEFGIYEKK